MESDLTNSLPLVRLVDELYLLLDESAKYHTDSEVCEILELAARTVQNLRGRLQIAGRRYTVAVVGLTNVGKSTLLNALLGADVAPRRNGPCTAAPVEFAFGPELRVTAYYQRRIGRRSWRAGTTDEIHLHLATLADDAGLSSSETIRRVVVEIPTPLLEGDLVLADTPGFGAAQVGEAAGSHEQALRKYLGQEVSQVLWVVLAEQGIGKREIAFHNHWFSQICDDVIVTGSEDWDAQDQQRYRRRFAGQFGQRIPRFHFVSGLQGLLARQRGDQAALEMAGIPVLENRIRELASAAGREAMIQEQLRQLADDVGFWLGDFRDGRDRPLREWWRPDSWGRWQQIATQSALAKQLTNHLAPRK